MIRPLAKVCLFALVSVGVSLSAAVTSVSRSADDALSGRGWRFDSDQGVGLNAEIKGVRLVTAAATPEAIQKAVITQLFFIAGALNEKKSGAELGHASIKIQSITAVAETKLNEVLYDVNVLVGWHKSFAIPQGLRMAVPASSDDSGLNEFYETFHKNCSEDAGDTDLSPESFYYYYRPEQPSCPLYSTHASPNVVSYLTMKLSPSPLQTEGKFPEYAKVHEDRRVVATMIFGTNIEKATANSDAGIAAYNQTYSALRKVFGLPDYQSVSLAAKKLPGKRHPDVEMHWALDGGEELDVNLLLIDKYGLIEPEEAFAQRYNERTKNADYVAYSGHSGFGENIRALAKLGNFQKGQYQIFNVNGCDTFFYVDDALRAAHEAVNPGSKPYEYFDVITNSMPSPFAGMAMVGVNMVRALVERKETYRQIMAKFPARQHAIVMGEEDNVWKP